MAEKIYDNISEISKAIKDLNKQATEASKTTKSLNEDLKLDPTNVELASQRFAALNRELDVYKLYQKELIEHENALQAAQQKGVDRLATLDKSSDEYKKLEKELQQYNAELTKTERAADRASSQIKRLQAVINGINAKKAADEAAVAKKKFDTLRTSMDALEKAGRRLQVAFALIVGVFTKITKEAISQGTELYTLSKRYRTSAENIQYWNRALQLATGESDLFTKSLQVMSKGLSTIPVGRGVAYNNALRGIGVSFQAIRDLDPTAQFEAIIEGLKNVTDESLRGSYAIQLFGDSGQTIASALSGANGEFEQYLEKAKQFSVITQGNVEKLANMGFEFEALSSQMKVASVQAAINLYPTFFKLFELFNKTGMPLLVGLSKNGWLLYAVIVAILALKIVPAVTKWILQLMAAKAAQDSLTYSMLLTKAAALGVIGILGVAAFAAGKAAMEANNTFNAFADEANQAYSGIGGDLNTTVEKMTTQSTERTITMNVDIHGEGDTAISDESAQKVAQLTIDGIQKQLGDLIK